jgi:hypothetical protein
VVLRLDKVTAFAEPGLLLKGKTMRTPKKAAAKKARKKRTQAAPPVESQVWWDDDLRRHADGFAGDIDAVMNEADKLERWANQLRGYQQAAIQRHHRVELNFSDTELEALMEFKKCHCGADSTEADAARHLLRFAISHLPQASGWIDRMVKYTDDEGLAQAHFTEAAAKASTAEWRRQLAAAREALDDHDDDLPGDEWKKTVK